MSEEKYNKIVSLVNSIALKFSDIPKDIIASAIEVYRHDNRPYEDIEREIYDFSKKIEYMDQVVSRDVDNDILDNSILLIGPMGTGKSSIANGLQDRLKMPKVSLDDAEFLKSIYKDRDKFDNFKDFEFYLTSTVLTSLPEPVIIDFGAGHSVYENPIVFYEMKKLISRFRNVELVLPDKDMDKSLGFLSDRLKGRYDNGIIPGDVVSTNKHFLESPCNYELATDVVYSMGKSNDDVVSDIIENVQSKKIEKGKQRVLRDESKSSKGFISISLLLIGIVLFSTLCLFIFK